MTNTQIVFRHNNKTIRKISYHITKKEDSSQGTSLGMKMNLENRFKLRNRKPFKSLVWINDIPRTRYIQEIEGSAKVIQLDQLLHKDIKLVQKRCKILKPILNFKFRK
jgi:hypothetical protein